MPTLRVLDNIPEQDVELIEVPLSTLVDPLPHLKQGKWEGVNVERFAPKRKVRPQGQPKVQTLPDISGKIGGASTPRQPLPPELMLRSFDFSVSTGQTYRYRARIVVRGRPEVGRPREVYGDWSQPTDAVTVPWM